MGDTNTVNNDTTVDEVVNETGADDFDWEGATTSVDLDEDDATDSTVQEDAEQTTDATTDDTQPGTESGSAPTVEGDQEVTETPEPVVATQEPQQPEQSATQQQPQQQVKPDDLLANVQKTIQDSIPKLEQLYAFSDEDASAMQTEPELVIPRLAAKMHAEIMSDVLQGIKAIVPHYVTQHTTQVSAEEQAWNDFYSANEDLRTVATRDQVLAVAQIYRQMHPQAQGADLLKGIGKVMRQTMGLPDPQAAPTTPPSPQTKPRPFTPAQGRSQGTQVKPDNIWAELSEADDLL